MAITIALIIVVPYAWYAIRIHNFAFENKPDGFQFPSFSNLWVTALGMMALISLRKFCSYLHPLCMLLTPTHDSKKEPISEEERIEIAKKIERHIIDFTVYTSSSIWGLMICKE